MHKYVVFLTAKTRLFTNFATLNEKSMVIATQIKECLAAADYGMVLTINDFGIEPRYHATLVKALNRKVAIGELQKVSKGKYYKPKKTVFGSLSPAPSEIVKDLLEKNGKTVGYITGTAAFASMGLTTQITSAIMVGTNRYRRPITRGESKISFLVQPNSITEENIPLLRTLDAIKLIREIPATSPDDSTVVLGKIISALTKERLQQLCQLAEAYKPSVRALLGAILENNNQPTFGLEMTLNGVTTYKLPISKNVLPNKHNWNIL